jgi:hypothetical protein
MQVSKNVERIYARLLTLQYKLMNHVFTKYT